jgi:hypothetical protein
MSTPKPKGLLPGRLAFTTLALIGTLFSVDRAVALTCLYESLTLAENYTNAVGIVVAEVEGCANGAEPTSGWCQCADGARPFDCPDRNRYRLRILEVLKDSVPPQDFSGAYEGGDGMTSCGHRLIPGESYLLFISGPGSINRSAGGALTGDGAWRDLHETLAILRDYRNGWIDDLDRAVNERAKEWRFQDNSLLCELAQGVADLQMTFLYPYVDDFAHYGYMAEFDDEGYATSFVGAPIDPVAAAADGTGMTIEGPQHGPRVLVFTATFNPEASTIPDSATIRLGDKTWKLVNQTTTIRVHDTVVASLVSDVASDGDALEILQLMLEPHAGVARKQRANTELGPNDDLVIPIEIRPTQMRAEAAKFLACMDGSVRSRPVRGDNQ